MEGLIFGILLYTCINIREGVIGKYFKKCDACCS